MEAPDFEWQDLVRTLEHLGQEVGAWPETDPDPSAGRCEFSRHRTLAHLRAAQQTWLEVVLLFAAREGASIKRRHPWRLFSEEQFESQAWSVHMEEYLADRAEWLALVKSPDLDRYRGGCFNGQICTIASQTAKLVGHERHHVAMFR